MPGSSRYRRTSYAPAAVLVAFNAVAYGVYLAIVGVEQVRGWSSGGPVPIDLLLFHIIYALMWISYCRLILTHPGSVPPDHIWTCSDGDVKDAARFALTPDELELMQKIAEPGFYPYTEPLRERIRRLPFAEIKAGQTCSVRQCSKCVPAHYKPDRTHHCSRTDICVLVMDHYCTFAHTTIGLRNRKFFVLFLFYAVLTLYAYLAIMAAPLWASALNIVEGELIRTDAVVVLVCVTVACLAAGVSLFLSFHIYILAQNLTTIEFREKRQSRDGEVRRRAAIAHFKFDRGYWANLTQVLGSGIWLWPLPIQTSDPEIDGLYIDAGRLRDLTTPACFVTVAPFD